MTFRRALARLELCANLMDTAAPTLECLKLLAAHEAVPLDVLGRAGLEDLLAQGLIRKDERPKQASLEARYESLQETHRHILEARGCVDRLNRRMAPRFRLVGLLPIGKPPTPGPEDPDVAKLHELLRLLKIQIRGVVDLAEVPGHLDRIQDYLQVEGREGLDRLADTDREIDLLQKQIPMGTLVEPEGYFTLTPAGEAALPEAPVLENLEPVLQTAFGPLTHHSASAQHLREDPGGLLAFFLEGMALGQRPSSLVGEYERLLEAYDRISYFSHTRSLRARIGFLVRLLRMAHSEPKQAYLWCNRERLNDLLQRMRSLVPSSVAASGWHLPYAADLFLVDGGLVWDETQAEQRTRIYEAVRVIQSDLLQDLRIGDGQFVRLSLALTHAARSRNFAPGILMDRFIRQALEAVMEASHAAPYDLGDRGTRLLFGAHLAHAAGFAKARLPGPTEAFTALHGRLRGDHGSTRVPIPVLLHALSTLDRLAKLGEPLPLETYAGTLERILKRLRHHKAVARALHTAQALDGDEEALAANLCARVCFLEVLPPASTPHHPDAGLAGLYEERIPGLPPIMGSPFGTLMLA